MEYIAAVLGHLKSDAFSFHFSLFFGFNLISIGKKKTKSVVLASRTDPFNTHTPRGGSHRNTIHNDDGTYLLVQATSRTCYTADFIPPQSAFLTTMERTSQQ